MENLFEEVKKEIRASRLDKDPWGVIAAEIFQIMDVLHKGERLEMLIVPPSKKHFPIIGIRKGEIMTPAWHGGSGKEGRYRDDLTGLAGFRFLCSVDEFRERLKKDTKLTDNQLSTTLMFMWTHPQVVTISLRA